MRMNRSDPGIGWGFTLRQHGGKLVVGSVDRDSLSDKAGMKPDDEVDAVCGRNAKNMGINEANSIIDNSYQEVNFNLRRYVTSHTCLPWTLTEQDNKLVVDEVRPGYGTGFGTGRGFEGQSTWSKTNQQSTKLKSSWDSSAQSRTVPVQLESSRQNDFSSHSSNRTAHQGSYVATNTQPRVYHSPSSYAQHEQSSYSRHEMSNAAQGNGYIPSYSTHTKTNFSSDSTAQERARQVGAASAGYQSDANPPNTTSSDTQRHSSSDAPTAAQNYSFNEGVTTSTYRPSNDGTPLNQATFVQTSQLSPSVRPSGYSPGGTRVYYHAPSPRTRRELAPNASIQHLQYNSPMNLYSVETAAEQYTQQTGRPVDLPTSLRTQSPAYLTSEAKKLIEEQEQGRAHRIASPSAQSSSFKRISQAVGEPVH